MTARAEARPPRYIDAMLDDFARPGAVRFNHLGHWDPEHLDARSVGRVEAQERMVDVVAGLAAIAPGATVLDAGSGFGGTAQRIEASYPGARVVGLDIDARQLATCRDLRPSAGGSLLWLRGDACRLPLATGTIDAVISIEVMWHLPSRADFIAEVARVLRPGGRFAAVELEVASGAASAIGCTEAELERVLREGFGPWPELHVDLDLLAAEAARWGLRERGRFDASAATAPTFLDHGDAEERPGAAQFAATAAVERFVELHRRGLLRVWYLSYERMEGGSP